MKSKTDNDTSALENEVRDAVELGHDVQEMVRQLILRKISTHSLDIESLRHISGAVLRGARAGVHNELQHSSAQTKNARKKLKQAVSGLDVALAQFAEASKLAMEEATKRAQEFSKEDIARARANMGSLEEMFLETLQASASSAKDVASEILNDMITHARLDGSAVSAQIKKTLSVISHQLGIVGRAQAGTGLHLAQATSDVLRQIAAGVLSGLADHIKPEHKES